MAKVIIPNNEDVSDARGAADDFENLENPERRVAGLEKVIRLQAKGYSRANIGELAGRPPELFQRAYTIARAVNKGELQPPTPTHSWREAFSEYPLEALRVYCSPRKVDEPLGELAVAVKAIRAVFARVLTLEHKGVNRGKLTCPAFNATTLLTLWQNAGHPVASEWTPKPAFKTE